FVIEPLASSWKISAVPFLLEGIDLKSFLDRVLSDVFDGKSIRRGIVLKEELAMRACKAAVKGGQTLSTKEAELLIERINEGMELLCPHGRPILLRFHKRDLEKGFKRVL
ncbi:MAG: DNA mismatch repair protein MutL, partial [Clostridia bacterium]|nr:DNA mismatch repair protein MutL [Clostridia bacterium]